MDKGFSGAASFFDTAGYDGMDVAIQEINAQGGIHGCKFKVDIEDDKSTPALGAEVAQKEIAAGADILDVADTFTGGIGAAKIGEKDGLLVLSLAGSSTQFGTAVGPHMFNAGIDTTVLGRSSAQFALSRGWKTMYEVLTPSIAYFPLQSKAFRAAYHGGRVVGTAINKSFEGATANFSSAIAQIRATKPSVIYDLLTFPASGALVKQVRAAGIETPILGDVTLDSRTFVAEAGAAATKNVYYVTQVFWVGKGTSEGVSATMVKFDHEYEKIFHKFPDQSNAPESYQAFFAIAKALRKPGVVSSDGHVNAGKAAAALESEHDLAVPGGTLVDWHKGYAVWDAQVIGFTPAGNFKFVKTIPSGPDE